MSKTSKAKQLMTICLSVPLAAGAVFVAPTASANYAVVKVFDTPEVQYINVHNTADTSSNENIIDTISAGSFVWPMCWISGSAVPSPFSGQPASTIWYREAYSAAGETWFGWWLVEHYLPYHVNRPNGCDSGEPTRGR